MIKNKKGDIPKGFIWAFGIIILLIVGMIFINNFRAEEIPKDIPSKPLGDALTSGDLTSGDLTSVDWSALNFVSYIAGGVPEFLINEVGSISASIIILALFIMFVFTFGDILSTFGMFSNTTAWIIGIVLSIIAANLKLVMYLAVWSFAIVAGVGVLSVVVGVTVPLIIFLVLNIFLGAQLKHLKTSRDIVTTKQEVRKGAGAVKAAINAFKEAAGAFRTK